MKSLEERVQQLEDETAIRSLVARFSDVAITADYSAFRQLWAKNGKWTIHEPFFTSSEGIESIEAMLRNLRTGRAFFVQFDHSGVIKLNGDFAIARWVMREVSKGPGEVYYNNYAMYIDTMERKDGEWRFLTRDYHYIWIDTNPFPGEIYNLPENAF